jgi:hypothetical protein
MKTIRKREVWRRRQSVDYDKLCQISDAIRKDAEKHSEADSKRKALAVRNQLLMKWLTVLPWRAHDLRKCKLGGQKEGANLFKARIARNSMSATPEWVREAVDKDPRQKFWHFLFRESETKRGTAICGLLPSLLVPILEECVKRYRPFLAGRNDPGTLFVNDAGRSFSTRAFTRLVENLTERHAGQRVSPRLFRYAFAIAWLKSNPNDYLTLAKVLWHRSISSTLEPRFVNLDGRKPVFVARARRPRRPPRRVKK